MIHFTFSRIFRNFERLDYQLFSSFIFRRSLRDLPASRRWYIPPATRRSLRELSLSVVPSAILLNA
jgi:hypothetical protein